MMTQIPHRQRWILFFVFYICENPHRLLCFGHISTSERRDASFQVSLLHLMMYDVSTVCKYFSIGFFEQAWYYQWKIWNCASIVCHFSNKFLVKLFIFSPTRLHFYLSKFLIFYYILSMNHLLVKKSIVNEEGIVNEWHIKGTRKFLSEFCLKVLSIEFDIKFLSFVSFKRFSGVIIYKIYDALLPLTQDLYSSFPAFYISSRFS